MSFNSSIIFVLIHYCCYWQTLVKIRSFMEKRWFI